MVKDINNLLHTLLISFITEGENFPENSYDID